MTGIDEDAQALVDRIVSERVSGKRRPLVTRLERAGLALAASYELPATPRAEHLARVEELRAAAREHWIMRRLEQATRPEAAE